ncbi:exosome complex subunit Rrp46 [Blumeria hordei DH14]|uniref:Exosome complex subunit Rrp46 n=1 Tax=Blumeria graminis f. sp. hordei (strain DH14) TaxID=546991 RepID=N1JES9_BLUG1|nr:exosome complex subunit Rrp46 [Blumeria hordei DH14]
MATADEPSITLSHLHRADGSATFSRDGFTVIGAVNGPLEVSRRDEIPDKAVVDVTIRPAVGSGDTRERYLESILQSSLRQIILVQDFPRSLIQITLQVIDTPENDFSAPRGVRDVSSLALIPALIQTAILSLLSASIPMIMTLTSIHISVQPTGSLTRILPNPSISQMLEAKSIHVLAFTSQGNLLLAESEGSFMMDEWNEIYNTGKQICCQGDKGEGQSWLIKPITSSVRSKISEELHWQQ